MQRIVLLPLDILLPQLDLLDLLHGVLWRYRGNVAIQALRDRLVFLGDSSGIHIISAALLDELLGNEIVDRCLECVIVAPNRLNADHRCNDRPMVYTSGSDRFLALGILAFDLAAEKMRQKR